MRMEKHPGHNHSAEDEIATKTSVEILQTEKTNTQMGYFCSAIPEVKVFPLWDIRTIKHCFHLKDVKANRGSINKSQKGI